MNLYLGIDFGTSGARAVVINSAGIIQSETQYSFLETSNKVTEWQQALFTLIEQIPQEIRHKIQAIALNGTSSTVMLCDSTGTPITEPLMYNDGRGIEFIETLKTIAPPNHNVISATSSLAKLLWLIKHSNLENQHYYLLHQADWLAFLLHGRLGISDYHNALKLGYDVENLSYPTWLQNLTTSIHLPEIVAPGTPISEVLPDIADKLQLNKNCLICAGTTDSIAAFLASGAKSPGEAVTSLGSTLVLKLLSHTRIDNSHYGIYSHRLGDLWLVGGASNTGGAVLKHFFNDAQLESISSKIDSNKESPLDYYPLLKPGDRFPINDPHLSPKLLPKPADPVEFLHGLLEGIARIEGAGLSLVTTIRRNPDNLCLHCWWWCEKISPGKKFEGVISRYLFSHQLTPLLLTAQLDWQWER